MAQEFFAFISDHYYLPLYFLTLLLALGKYKKYFDTELRYLPILIAYTFFNELLGYFIRYNEGFSFFDEIKYSAVNDIIYNIYGVIFYGYFYHVYRRLNSNLNHKKAICYASGMVLLTYVISLFFQNPIETNLYYANAIAAWVLLFCIILYFMDKKAHGVAFYQKYNLVFWISIALLSFYAFFPILYLIGYLDYDTWMKYNLRTLLKMLILIMYALFIIGFIVSRRRAFR